MYCATLCITFHSCQGTTHVWSSQWRDGFLWQTSQLSFLSKFMNTTLQVRQNIVQGGRAVNVNLNETDSFKSCNEIECCVSIILVCSQWLLGLWKQNIYICLENPQDSRI